MSNPAADTLPIVGKPQYFSGRIPVFSRLISMLWEYSFFLLFAFYMFYSY